MACVIVELDLEAHKALEGYKINDLTPLIEA